jgi:hypothetical protein
MMQPRHAKILAAAMACGMVLFSSVQTSAQTKFLEHVRRAYEMDRTNGKCELCHQIKAKEEPGRKNLNALGKKIQDDPEMKPLLGKTDTHPFTKKDLELVHKIMQKFDNEDLDGDGVSNYEEYQLGTFPTDPKSIPEKLPLKKWREAHPDKAFKGGPAAPAKK